MPIAYRHGATPSLNGGLTMGKFDHLPYETIIHDLQTGRLAPLAEIIARHSREQNISLGDADAYVKEMLEIPTSRFHIEDERVEGEGEEEEVVEVAGLTVEIQRVQYAQAAAQTLLATLQLLPKADDVGLEPARIRTVLRGAFSVLEQFYGEEEEPETPQSTGEE